MCKIKTENLFTDMYALREYYFNEDKNSSIICVQNEVERTLEDKDFNPNLRYLLFKLTNYCNSNCAYCSHAAHRSVPELKNTISHDLVMKTIEEAAQMGVQAISVSGGEPLLREDIFEIIHKIVECKMIPVLLTNGLLLDRYWDELGKAGLRYIVMSIDSVDRATYEKQRGASFDLAMKGIEAARKLRDKYGRSEIHVSSVLTKNNHEDFLNLVSYMRERDIRVQVIPYHKRKDDLEDFSITDGEKITSLVSRLIEMKSESGVIANSVGFLQHIPDYFKKGIAVPENFNCKVGYTSLCIDAYMDVKPCWSYMFEPLGNLRNSSLTEIWNSEKMQEYRERMLKCECEGCWYLCTSEICMMLDGDPVS